jgi:hypothetical protein
MVGCRVGSGRSVSPLSPLALFLPFFFTTLQFVMRHGKKFTESRIKPLGFVVYFHFLSPSELEKAWK